MCASPLTTICLDAGNTLLGMDYDLLAGLLAAEGIACSAAAVGRAEAAARPALSRHLAGGRSTETTDTFEFYVRRTLEQLPGDGAAARDGTAGRLVSALRTTGTRRLWSRVLPGVPEALTALRAAGLRLVVVSNADGTAAEGLAAAGLASHLDAVIDSTVVGVEKPDPRIFAHALAAVGGQPERALHVGDLYAIDVVGARAAGLAAVLLDPYGDWEGVDCERVPDLPTLARRLLEPGWHS